MKKININQNNVTAPNLAADTININNTTSQRHLNSQMIVQLEEALNKKDDNIEVTAILGDSEAFKFATEIMHYLKNAGYQVNGVSQAIYSAPIKGQIIDKDPKIKNKVRIIIGNNDR